MIDVKTPLHILIVEDSEDDMLLLLRELRVGGLDVVSERVYSAETVADALRRVTWDVVLSDYLMPGFSGMHALNIVQSHQADLPFIFVSGVMGEENAVQAMRAGASDFFVKGKLARLVPAVLREVRDARERAQRRDAEHQLRMAEARFAKVFETNPDGIAITTVGEGQIIEANPRLLSMFGFSREEMIGRTALELGLYVDPSERGRLMRLFHETGSVDNEEVLLRTKDGRHITVLISFEKVEMGQDSFQLAMIHDITQRKERERRLQESQAALRESERFARSTLDALSATIGILDETGKVVAVNKAWRDFWLADPDSPANIYEGDNFLALCDRTQGEGAETAHAIAEGVRGVMRGERDLFTIEYPLLTPREKEWLYCRVTRFHGDGPVRVVVAHENITERKQAENELKALYNATSVLFQADSLLALGQQVTDAVIAEFGKVHCSLMLVDRHDNAITGLAQAGNDNTFFNHRLTLDGPGLIAKTVRTGSMIYTPDVFADPDYLAGDATTHSELVVPLIGSKGVIGVLDLQSRERDAFGERDQRVLQAFAERVAGAIEMKQLYEEINHYAGELEWSVARRTAELHRAKEHVEAILNNSSDGIALATLEGEIQRTNPAFLHLFGYNPHETIGDPITELIEHDQVAALDEALQGVAVEFAPRRLELVCRRLDGSVFNADMGIAPVMEFDSNQFTVVYSVRDITARKQAEENLRAALEKEKEVNELKTRFTSMVSHEFRNPLAVIQSASDLLKHYGERMSAERKHDQLEEIQRQVKHLTGLLEDFLAISRAQSKGVDVQAQSLHLGEFLTEIVREIQLTTGDHTILFTPNGYSGEIMADPKLLRQAVANLLTNAVKYSPDAATVWMNLHYEPGNVVIEVKDQGIGIPPEDIERLFDVFHRARNVGSIAGTGLGLAIVKQSIEAHGGTVRVESVLGEGTTFLLTLPRGGA